MVTQEPVPAAAFAAGRKRLTKRPIPFGKYLLLERVNVGGMAEVFIGKAFGVEGFERILAIKKILPTMVEDEEFITMFIDEARIAVQLNHANIVQIFELGKHDENYYIAMEYVSGRDLRLLLDRYRRRGEIMPTAQAVFIVSKICEGLDYAHRKKDARGQDLNIVHRDVSPQNLLISYDGDIKLIDFGIAKAANRAQKTQAGILKGKFGYMSPEQVRGLPIDRRSDIFALGVILYECLTGEKLFMGESDFSTLEKVRNAAVAPPRDFNDQIPPALEKVVLKALAREPEDRYQWSSDLQEDLMRFLLAGDTVFSAKHLGGFMKESFAEDQKRERDRMNEFLAVPRPQDMENSVVTATPTPDPRRRRDKDASIRTEPISVRTDPTGPVPSGVAAAIAAGPSREPSGPRPFSRELSKPGSKSRKIDPVHAAAIAAGHDLGDDGPPPEGATEVFRPSFEASARSTMPGLAAGSVGPGALPGAPPVADKTQVAAPPAASPPPAAGPADLPAPEDFADEDSLTGSDAGAEPSGEQTLIRRDSPAAAGTNGAASRDERFDDFEDDDEDADHDAKTIAPTEPLERMFDKLAVKSKQKARSVPPQVVVEPAAPRAAGKPIPMAIIGAVVAVLVAGFFLLVGGVAIYYFRSAGTSGSSGEEATLTVITEPPGAPVLKIEVDGAPVADGPYFSRRYAAGKHTVKVITPKGEFSAVGEIVDGKDVVVKIGVPAGDGETNPEAGGGGALAGGAGTDGEKDGDGPKDGEKDGEKDDAKLGGKDGQVAQQVDGEKPEDAQPPPPPKLAVRIETDPPGAAVRLDRGKACRTPCRTQVEPGREYAVDVTAPRGYKDQRTKHAFTEGEGARLALELEKREPPKVTTGNGGGKKDTTPPRKDTTPPKKDGAAAKGGAKGAAKTGFLIVGANKTAQVFVDGKATGRWTPVVPANPLELPVGKRKIMLVTAEGEKRTADVEIKEGERARVAGIKF